MGVPLMFQPLVKYAQFDGRSRRSEFWLWVLFRILVGMALGALTLSLLVPFISAAAANPHMDDTQARSQVLSVMSNIFRFYPLFGLVELGLFIPSLAVAVRRLHDINRSGLWLLMPIGVSIGGLIVMAIAAIITGISMATSHADDSAGAAALGGIAIGYAVWLLALLAADIVLLIFMLTEGTRGPNRFGDDPKAVIA